MVEALLFVGGIGTGLLVGCVFGARHAFEADHIAAVAALIESQKRPAITGAAWGIGHSLPILLLGATFLALDFRASVGVATAFELLVSVILVALGIRVIVGCESLGVMLFRHIHQSNGEPSSMQHRHISIVGRDIGLTHSHADEESLAIGVVHGLAGSGGVVVALAATAPTMGRGAAFLIGFSIASIFAMSLAAWTWGRVVSNDKNFRTIAGLGSIAVGVLLFAETVGVTIPI